MMRVTSFKAMLRGAMLTALTLFGGTLLGFGLGQITFNALPGHSLMKPSAVPITLSVIPALTGLFIGSALWGILIGRLGQATNRRRMAVAGMLGFVPITLGLGLVLNALEPVAVEHLGAHVPIHRLFTLLFVPTVFVIAGLSAWVIGHGLRNTSLAWTLLWRVGGAAALAFLTVNLVMEALGWVVGAPRAAERFTMVTVTLAGSLGAALVGGAVLGRTLGTTVAKPVQRSAD